jgi:hypothetical protein
MQTNEIHYFTNTRLSFPNLIQAGVSKKFPNSPPMFSADIIVDQNHPAIASFMQRYAELAAAEWKENAQQVMQMIQADRRARCFGTGAEKVSETTLKIHPGYEGKVWFAAKNKNRPQIIKSDGSVATNEMEAQALARKMYGGCYVNVALRPWIRLTNRGVSCDLVAIQFAGDGEAFGDGAAVPDVTSMFGAVGAAPTPAAPAFPSFLSQ